MGLSDDDLIKAIRAKAQAEASSTLPPAPKSEIDQAEQELGFPLHPFLRRLLTEVANGGFGPCARIYGVGLNGYRDDDLGGGLVEVRAKLASGPFLAMLGMSFAPFEDLGCGAWLYVDCASPDGRLILLAQRGLFQTRFTIREWMSLWVDGKAARESLFDASKAPRRNGINPFTRKPIVIVGEGEPLGERLHHFPDNDA